MRCKEMLAVLPVLMAGTAFAAEYPCVMEPYKVVNVSTAVEGLLKEVKVDKGDLVAAGDVVATLDSEVEAALVAEARARVNLRAVLEAREVRLKRAQSRYGRGEDLSKKQFISPDEMEEMASEVEVAELELQAEREKIALARLELARVSAQYDMRFIKSPIEGMVVQRFLSGGEFAQAQPILTLAQLHPLHVEVVLPASVYGSVRQGMAAEVMPAEPVGGTHDARVKLVEQVIDAASATFGVRLELPNPDYALPAGLECRVRFLDEEASDAVAG